MPLVVADRVQETSTTSGTGALTLAGAVNGYRTFSSGVGNGNTTYYAISDGTDWEVGLGTYTSAGNTLSRDTVLSSSNGNALVSFSSATKNVWGDYPAGKSVYSDGSNAIQLGRQAANYFQTLGSAANITPELSVLGSDTNIPFTIETKGTGAINLSAGSRGVNVANGQTVTAITVSNNGSGYSSAAAASITPPTTVNGVQATATCEMRGAGAITVSGGGTGYTLNDTLTVVGGTFTTAQQLTVTGVSGGVITSVSFANTSNYTVCPSMPVSVTGGTGSSATFSFAFGVRSLTITNAGSGYVEQPTVTFSGGGGAGAAAYATVGSGTTVRTLGSTMSFSMPNGEVLRLSESASSGNYIEIQGSASSVGIFNFGTLANIPMQFRTRGTGQISFSTGTSVTNEQLRVSHTASAVNYVQVTGAATGGSVQITTQGSDNNVGTIYGNKGVGTHSFRTGGTTSIQFQITNTTNAVNRLEVTGGVAGAAPVLACLGSDTNIDLALTPKGTGLVRFGTYTATVSTITGYIEIKDSGGTTRRLAVVS